MPVEEHKELRDLVTQTLQAKGVLQKVQAEIRASVFLALEEQEIFKEKSPFINQPLKEYVSSPEGLITISLVREFLEFFNLEFTTMVFDPETHASLDYNYEGRSKIAKDLELDSVDNKVPLLGLIVKLLTSAKKNSDPNSPKNFSITSDVTKGSDSISEQSEKYSNGLNGNLDHRSQSNNVVPSEPLIESEKTEDKSDLIGKRIKCSRAKQYTRQESRNALQLAPSLGARGGKRRMKSEKFVSRVNVKKDNLMNTSLTSLGNLPPLSKAASNATSLVSNKPQSNMKDLKALLDLEPGSNFEDLLSSSINKERKKGGKAESDDSEVEDEVSEVASAVTDDNTVDVSISKESGKGDYFEDL